MFNISHLVSSVKEFSSFFKNKFIESHIPVPKRPNPDGLNTYTESAYTGKRGGNSPKILNLRKRVNELHEYLRIKIYNWVIIREPQPSS